MLKRGLLSSTPYDRNQQMSVVSKYVNLIGPI